MKNVVMGTAGHIDHGKTALVKRLTGIDADRLEEEKRRGMTIELGFAPLTLPSGNVISIIDVPGHEKFVKNMVAGATGIDFVMLVIAADEGVMPQTREHIDILTLLNVKMGVVALTKVDLVDDEWLEMVKDDVRKALIGSTLETIPIIPVSSITGVGIDNLIKKFEKLTIETANIEGSELFRMPIDRVFTMTGYGTVITGTVSSGKISKGNVIEIMPSELTARIRGIQVHNNNTENAHSGDRCALNLSGIERDDIQRGDIVASPGIIRPTIIVDAVLYVVNNKEDIYHNQRVHVHIGTKEVLARIRVLGDEKIPSGGKGYVQLRFEEPVPTIRKDRFIIRSYSPVTTIGGGWVVFHYTQNRKRFSDESIKALSIGEHGNLRKVTNHIIKISRKLLNLDDLWKEILEDRNKIQNVLNEEIVSGNILWIEEINKYLSRELFNDYIRRTNIEFELLYKRYPYRYQIDREEIKSKIFYDLDPRDFSALLNLFISNKVFDLKDNFLVQPGNVAINRISAMEETLFTEKYIFENGLNTKSIQQLHQELTQELKYKLKHVSNKMQYEDDIYDIIKFLVQTGKIIDLGDSTLIHKNVLSHSIKIIRSILNKQESVTAAQVRDILKAGRKSAIAILEYLDSIEITQRVDNIRKPGVHYMDYHI